MSKRKELAGQSFGSWYVEEFDVSRSKWKVRCKCQSISYVSSHTLLSGKSTQCKKCRNITIGYKNSTHGLSKTRLHGIWNMMKQRCNNPNQPKYKDYGGRGIKVCNEWQNSFESFYLWAMSNGYSDELSIDRIDVNGNYEPNNCRWVTNKVQSNNTRVNHCVEYNGESHTMAEWAEITGIKRETIRERIKSGWSVERALTEKPFIGKNQTFRGA